LIQGGITMEIAVHGPATEQGANEILQKEMAQTIVTDGPTRLNLPRDAFSWALFLPGPTPLVFCASACERLAANPQPRMLGHN
jgi:hypothetical protein